MTDGGAANEQPSWKSGESLTSFENDLINIDISAREKNSNAENYHNLIINDIHGV